MLNRIKHAVKYGRSLIREKIKEKTRSPEWKKTRDNFLEANQTCAACGSKNNLQVHHIQPFHLHPELELEESNLITLCMDQFDCHLNLGHGDNFKAYNPNVVSDSRKFFIGSKKKREKILQEAKENRIIEST